MLCQIVDLLNQFRHVMVSSWFKLYVPLFDPVALLPRFSRIAVKNYQ